MSKKFYRQDQAHSQQIKQLFSSDQEQNKLANSQGNYFKESQKQQKFKTYQTSNQELTNKYSNDDYLHDDFDIQVNQMKMSRSFSQVVQKNQAQTTSQKQLINTQTNQSQYSQSLQFVLQSMISLEFIPKNRQRSFSMDQNLIKNLQINEELQQQQSEIFAHNIRKHSENLQNYCCQLSIETISNDIYLKIDKQVVTININLLTQIWNQYEKEGIVIPLVSEEVFRQNYLKKYFSLYFNYLLNINDSLLKDSIKKIQLRKQQSPHKKSLQSTKSLFKLPSLSVIFTKQSYSKAQILKKHLIQSSQTFNILKKFSQHKKTKQQQINNQLAVLQMLISFESSINFYKQKQNDKKQINFFHKYKQMQNKCFKEMKKWIQSQKICQMIIQL